MVTSFEHSLFHVKTQRIFVQGKQLRLYDTERLAEPFEKAYNEVVK